MACRTHRLHGSLYTPCELLAHSLTCRLAYSQTRLMPEPMLHVVLYQPEIPLNAGSLGRTCVAAGAKLWLVRPLGFRLDDRHLRRAGLDYWEHLDWEVVDNWSALDARIGGQRFWFATKHAERSLWEMRFELGDVLVFGSESRGLPRWLVEAHRKRAFRIPMRAEARSLNLANAASIVVYEALRQVQAAG